MIKELLDDIEGRYRGMVQALELAPVSDYEPLISLVVNAVDSPNSKRAYRRALEAFAAWHQQTGGRPLTKALVQEYKALLQQAGLSASSINVKLSAIRKMVQEAADNGAVEQVHANGIKTVKGARTEGVRAGNWLTREQAQALLNHPDPRTNKGLRDRAVLAVMLLAGLRRDEVAHLTVEHFQLRDNRWVIVDLVGKWGKIRSVPVKAIVKSLVDDWCAAADITSGPLWRGFRKGDHIIETPGMSAQAV